ncbi:MAG: glycosyltransferase, partial [Lachnospiraceae bacterium]|nr:glycosyltransferase [Lachnospiraceae bacterium]
MISVVVPVYNVEKYLARCVESIRGQTFRELEILLVDDGSTDASGSLCDDLEGKDARIRVIHKANGGLSDARNAGLATATGEYVCFIDSDDWIEPDILERAAAAMEEADLVVWGYRKDFADEKEEVRSFEEQKISCLLTKGTGYQKLLQPGVLQEVGYAWNKMYRTALLRHGGHTFEKGLSLVEDAVFNYPLFLECDRIKFIDAIGSHYVQRGITTLGTA